MTGMELSIQAWCINFQTLWLDVCDTVPEIHKGSSPVRDLLKLQKSGSKELVWYYYSRRKFKEGYWEAFDIVMEEKFPTVNFGVGSSEFFTTVYDFGYDDGDEIPDLILVCFDLPEARTSF